MRILVDITNPTDRTLDLTRMISVPWVRVLYKKQHPFIRDIGRDRDAYITLSYPHSLTINPFRTLRALDLATPELFGVSFWQKWRGEGKRPRSLDLCPPLRIPFGGVDIRSSKGEAIISSVQDRSEKILFSFLTARKYPDLFVRTLPPWRRVIRFFRTRKRIWKRVWYGLFILTIALILFGIHFLQYIQYSFHEAEKRLEHILIANSNTEIQNDILKARATFERANIFLTPIFLFLDNPIIHIDRVRSARSIIDAWLATTRGVDALARTLPKWFTYSWTLDTLPREETLTPSYRAPPRDIRVLSRYGINEPTKWYEENRGAIHTFLSEMRNAENALKGFTTLWENTKDARILDLRDTLGRLTRYSEFMLDHEESLLRMLWHDEPMRYIVFNQNRDEIRANGWFPWTIFTFTLFQWNILQYRKDDVYYYDWNLFPNTTVPPAWLESFGTFWLRDVTYYPLFRESLEKANSFVEKSGEETITTGIALHQGIIEDILAKVWSVTLSWVSMPFTAENFSPLMSTLVEAKFAKEKTPKDILFTFADALEKKVINEGKIWPVLAILEDALSSGEITIRSRDDITDAFLRSLNTFDRFVWDKDNWVYPLFTNVGGNKSDRFVYRRIERTAVMQEDCRVENTLTIHNTHTFTESDESIIMQYLDMLGITGKEIRKKLLFIEGKGNNVSFIRIIAPFWSKLIDADTDVKTDASRLDYTVFSFNLETPIGATVSQTLRYSSRPTKCTEEWKIYKQPGLRMHSSEFK